MKYRSTQLGCRAGIGKLHDMMLSRPVEKKYDTLAVTCRVWSPVIRTARRARREIIVKMVEDRLRLE